MPERSARRLFGLRGRRFLTPQISDAGALPDSQEGRVGGHARCPVEVKIQGADVLLLAESERLGILLGPLTARRLALSLIAAAGEVAGA